LCSFEKTLKQKLSQKSSGATNEEAVLLKAFKYFDLNNNGTVEPDEFAKAVEKIGIMIPTRQVSPILTQGRKHSPALLFHPDGIIDYAMERLQTRYD